MLRNCQLYSNKQLHFKERSVTSHQILWLDARWNMKTTYSTFHPGLHYRKLCKASGTEKKKSQNKNSRVSQTAQELGVCFNKGDTAFRRRFHGIGFHNNSPTVRQRQWPEWQPGVVFLCQCVMERATGLKKLSDVKIGSMKLVISVTSNADQWLGNKEKPTLTSHLSSENNQVFPKIHYHITLSLIKLSKDSLRCEDSVSRCSEKKKLEYKKWRLSLPLCINRKLLVFTEEMLLGRGMEKPCSANPVSSTRGQGFPEGYSRWGRDRS